MSTLFIYWFSSKWSYGWICCCTCKNIVPIADNVTYAQAACIEPITVAIHGVERAGAIDSGKSAIVYGCGTIGILTMQCLKAKGLEKIYVIDIDDYKLELAKNLGAYEVLNSTNKYSRIF